MKILKKLMCCCLFVMLLCSHGMTAYALEIQDGTAVKLIVTDETGGVLWTDCCRVLRF